MEVLNTFVGGAGGAALVAGLFALIQWRLSRKAQVEDKAAEAHDAECDQRACELRDLSRKMDVLFLADRTLLYDRIKHLAKSYISRGWVTVEELEDLNRMHDVYHDTDKLNGNGFLYDLMNTVNNSLEIKGG